MVSFVLKTKPIRVSFNMFCCAVLFAAWGVKPRETISGFVGRKAKDGGFAWKTARKFIDSLHAHQVDHCEDTRICEERMRTALYLND